MVSGSEVSLLLELFEGKDSVSKGKAKDYLYEVGKEMGIVVMGCYDFASHHFDSEKAVKDLFDEFGSELPLYICSVWISQHSDESRYDEESKLTAERITKDLNEKAELFEYVSLEPIHPVLLNSLYLSLYSFLKDGKKDLCRVS